MKNSKLKIAALGILHFAFCILHCLADGTPTVPATQTEVNAGVIHNKYVAPDTLAHWTGGGGPGDTNGITQSDHQNSILSGTNNYRGTNLNLNGRATMRDLVITNSITNLAWTASTDLEADANKMTVSLANGTGVKTNNGSGVVGWSTLFPGTWIAPGTLPLSAINTNLITTVSAGANIAVTPSAIALGGTNFAIAVADPASLGQINVGTAWLTNTVTPTNTMGGTAIDFAISEVTTNMAGNMVLSSVANLTAGAYNRKVIHCLPNGSDRTVTIATGWGQGLNDTFVVTNGTRVDILAVCQPGVFTNVFQKVILVH